MFRGQLAIYVVAVFSLHAAEPLAARWEGNVQLPGRQIPLVIDLAQDAKGQWIGSATVPGYNAKGVPLTELAVHDTSAEFGIKGALGEPKLQGNLSADGFSGTYTQAGNHAPFALHRTGPPQVELPRRSTAVHQDIVGEWQGELVLGTRHVRVALKLANQPSGEASAQFHFSSTRETDLPVDLVTQDSGTLTLDAAGGFILYEARVAAGGGEITGLFRQGPTDSPLTLHPVGKGSGK